MPDSALTNHLERSTSDRPRSGPDSRYATLDGLRGLAALCVALFHFAPGIMSAGYLAVDFFFGLSGFVLMKAYEERLANGLATARFMWARLIRLYPLYLLGITLGVVTQLCQYLAGNPMISHPAGWIAPFVVNVLFLPWPFDAEPYPTNGVAWSLFVELLANLVMAAWLVRARPAILWVVCLIGGVLCLIGPAQAANGWQGIARGSLHALYTFTAGMIIARACGSGARSPRAITGVLFLGLMIALATGGSNYWAVQMPFILIGTPLLVAAGAMAEPQHFLRPAALWLGDVSYALYMVHVPLMPWVRAATSKAGLTELTSSVLFLTVSLLAAWLATRFVDRPMRRIMNGIGRRQARPA